MTQRFLYIILILTIAGSFFPTDRAQSGSPYDGEPWQVPGVIEAEDFDLGGEGIGYHDEDSANQGGQYRPEEGVDISITEDGAGSQYQVDWTTSGEWLQYTVEVLDTGIYTIIIREGLVNYATGNGVFHLEMDGVNITGELQTYTGVFWWQGYSTVTVPDVPLVQGVHELRLVMDNDASIGVGSV